MKYEWKPSDYVPTPSLQKTCPNTNGIYKNKNLSSRRLVDKISCRFDSFYCRFLTVFAFCFFVTIFLVDLTKMMSGQNQGTKLSIWRAIWSFCKVDFLVCIWISCKGLDLDILWNIIYHHVVRKYCYNVMIQLSS